MSKGEKNAMATNIQKYLAFLKTVEYGSFTRAGELLGYTQACPRVRSPELAKPTTMTVVAEED